MLQCTVREQPSHYWGLQPPPRYLLLSFQIIPGFALSAFNTSSTILLITVFYFSQSLSCLHTVSVSISHSLGLGPSYTVVLPSSRPPLGLGTGLILEWSSSPSPPSSYLGPSSRRFQPLVIIHGNVLLSHLLFSGPRLGVIIVLPWSLPFWAVQILD